MKAYKETIRKYYKYQYEDWTQPILTSNSTSVPEGIIETTASSQYTTTTYGAFRAMDGDYSAANHSWATNTTSGWWKVKFPYTLEITNISVVGRDASNGQIYDKENGNLIGTFQYSGEIPTDSLH